MARQSDNDQDRQDTEAAARLVQMISIGAVGAVLIGFVLWVLVQMAPLTPEQDSLTHMAIGFMLVILVATAYAALQKAISDS